MQQPRGHIQGADDGGPASKQHADHAVEPREVISADALTDTRHLPEFVIQPAARSRCLQGIGDERDDEQ